MRHFEAEGPLPQHCTIPAAQKPTQQYSFVFVFDFFKKGSPPLF